MSTTAPLARCGDRDVCVCGGLRRGGAEAVWPIEARGCAG
jgi:hypothetical protein